MKVKSYKRISFVKFLQVYYDIYKENTMRASNNSYYNMTIVLSLLVTVVGASTTLTANMTILVNGTKMLFRTKEGQGVSGY